MQKWTGHNSLASFFICRKAKPRNWLHVDFEYVTGLAWGLWRPKVVNLTADFVGGKGPLVVSSVREEKKSLTRR
jgi:hypothetical protein